MYKCYRIIGTTIALCSCSDIDRPPAPIVLSHSMFVGDKVICVDTVFEIGLPIVVKASVVTFYRRTLECTLVSTNDKAFTMDGK